ncbi:MAG: carbohydrate ABC transporter permease [bacterium]
MPGDFTPCGMVAVHGVLLLGALLMLTPLAWMLLTSLKSYQELFVSPPKWIPEKLLWNNYVEALTTFNFALYLRNTAFLTFVTIAGTLVSSCMAAYAFAALRCRGKGMLFAILISTLMLPPQVTIIPLFKVYARLNWIDTYLPLTIPAWLGTNVFAIFLLRQFFLTVPRDYCESARIDGASEFQILLRIFVPMCTPAILTISVFSFIGAWNDLWGPVIFLHSECYYTMAIGLLNFVLLSNQPQGAPWNLIMAVSTVMMIPIIIVFFLAQKRFIEGMSLAGLKG